MVTINKHYYYKGIEYVVVGFTQMKNPANMQWVDAVQYKIADEVDDPDAVVYTREQKNDFEYNFIPALLEVENLIAVESMGKLVGTYEVKEINDESKQATAIKVSDSSAEPLIVSVEVNSNGTVNKISGGETFAAVYYFFMEDMKTRLANGTIISQIVSTISEGATRAANISPAVSAYMLKETLNAVEQTLDNLYKTYEV